MYIGRVNFSGQANATGFPSLEDGLERRTREFGFLSPLHMKEERFRTR